MGRPDCSVIDIQVKQGNGKLILEVARQSERSGPPDPPASRWARCSWNITLPERISIC